MNKIIILFCILLSSCIVTLNDLKDRLPHEIWYPKKITLIESKSYDLDFAIAAKYKIKEKNDIKYFIEKNNLVKLEKKVFDNYSGVDGNHNHTIFSDDIFTLKNRIYYDEGNLFFRFSLKNFLDEHWFIVLNARNGELWLIHVAKDLA